MVKAKFKCIEKALTVDGAKITLEPVTHGSAENEEFFRYTPYGKIEIGTINLGAAKQFIPGAEYGITFEKVE